jgi:sulfur carrier protein ThiS
LKYISNVDLVTQRQSRVAVLINFKTTRSARRHEKNVESGDWDTPG